MLSGNSTIGDLLAMSRQIFDGGASGASTRLLIDAYSADYTSVVVGAGFVGNTSTETLGNFDGGGGAYGDHTNDGGQNPATLSLASSADLSPVPVALTQPEVNDCVYTVLAMAAQMYGDANYSTVASVRNAAVQNGLGDAANGVITSNIVPLACLLGFKVQVLSTTINGDDVVSFQQARSAQNAISNNRAVVYVENTGVQHSTLIYKSELWSGQGVSSEVRMYGVYTGNGTYPAAPFKTFTPGYAEYGYMISIYK